MVTTPHLGLKAWNLTTDLYDSGQLADNWARLDEHDHSFGKGTQIPTGGIADGAIIQSKIDPSVQSTPLNGSVTNAKLADGSVTTSKIANANVTADKLADAAKLGLTSTGVVRRGSTNISTTQTTNSATYTTLATPDQVQNVVLPTAGFIGVMYQAAWQESTSPRARAAIFLNSTQTTVALCGTAAPQTTAAWSNDNFGAGNYMPLTTTPTGLVSVRTDGAPYADVTTGQLVGLVGNPAANSDHVPGQEIGGVAKGLFYSSDELTGLGLNPSNWMPVGGPCYIFAAAGTYTVSIQFKAVSPATISVRNRKLWVWTMGF